MVVNFHNFKILLFFFIVNNFLTFSQSIEYNKKSLAIAPFESESNLDNIGVVVSEQIIGKIKTQFTHFEIKESLQLTNILKASIFSEKFKEDNLKFLKNFKIDYIMLGKIDKIDDKYYGSYRIIDINTGNLLEKWKDSISGVSKFENFIQELIKSMTSKGLIFDFPTYWVPSKGYLLNADMEKIKTISPLSSQEFNVVIAFISDKIVEKRNIEISGGMKKIGLPDEELLDFFNKQMGSIFKYKFENKKEEYYGKPAKTYMDEYAKQIAEAAKTTLEVKKVVSKWKDKHPLIALFESYQFIHDKWKYRPDPDGMDYVQSTEETITILDFTGDCEDFSILLMSVMSELGITSRLALVSTDKGGHTWLEILIAENKMKGKAVLKKMEEMFGSEMSTYEDKKGLWIILEGFPPKKYFVNSKKKYHVYKDGYLEILGD